MGLVTDICLWKGGCLWTECPNLGACELKMSKFGGLRAKICAKIEAVEVKIFSKGGLVNWLFCLKWDPCELQERRERGVFKAAHPHTPFLGQFPPPRKKVLFLKKKKKKKSNIFWCCKKSKFIILLIFVPISSSRVFVTLYML